MVVSEAELVLFVTDDVISQQSVIATYIIHHGSAPRTGRMTMSRQRRSSSGRQRSRSSETTVADVGSHNHQRDAMACSAFRILDRYRRRRRRGRRPRT